MMKRRITDTRDSCIEAIVCCGRKLDRGDLGEAFAGDYIRQYYLNVPIEDLRDRSAENLAGAALSYLKFARSRREGAAKVRVYNPRPGQHGWQSTYTIVELVNDDMPFLVDSVSMAINRLGGGIHLTVHPLLKIARNARGRLLEIHPARDNAEDGKPESFMRLEINRETDAAWFDQLKQTIETTLADVRASVEDWIPMRTRLLEACAELNSKPSPARQRELKESTALLEWLANDHFTFLGYREYFVSADKSGERVCTVPDSGLGILRPEPPPPRGTPLTDVMRRQARSREPLIITKANSRSTVHRPGYLDYIGVKYFDDQGVATREKRFLGMFTSNAYSRHPREIPLLRYKVQLVVSRSRLPPNSHRGKALTHILDNFPRDELFQSSVQDLSRTSAGILNLQERQQVRLFIRRDAFRRFYSCLLYVPREKYNTSVRQAIEATLIDAFAGESAESAVQISESALARVHIIVRTQPDERPRISIRQIEQLLVDVVRTWNDALRDELLERFNEERGLKLFHTYEHVFPAAYREDVTPREATFDIERLAAVVDDTPGLQMSLYRAPGFDNTRLRFKLFNADQPLPISDVLPMLKNLGLRVISERPYQVEVDNGDRWVWIQDFEMEHEDGRALQPPEISSRFQACLAAVIEGRAEDDGFNRLVIAADLDWRQAALLRGYGKYLLQTGMPFSQAYMEEVLYRNAEVARLIIDTFYLLFDPQVSQKQRSEQRHLLRHAFDKHMASVASLDQDRILRAFAAAIIATVRTNFFVTDEAGQPLIRLAIKLDSTRVPDLPDPRPLFEIFVYSPRVEGIHLRAGAVARGGLRWSDRREDFRTEVLGLMKAQNVKNTLIVPVGAKGGFVCKNLPDGDRHATQTEVLGCYKSFVRGLLDVTDNIVAGKVMPPSAVVRADGDDPYLVVATDKGTATFSDVANSIAAEYDFWTGDAFASGGSAGYDHKKMAITARGAWEAVKRHFRELAIDIQEESFSVAGIGDMAGDVFGNGMLLSPHINLRAAFNHRHIFLDPNPDPAVSFAERQRLFDVEQSSWEDYDPTLISTGGGVYPRDAKRLSRPAQSVLGIDTDELTPDALIKAILRMPVDLLWNGGIGTYVKAGAESHAEVGDRANDSVRIDAGELRCRVVGEGGNLALTQLARVEFALQDGCVNTDFIDNSAGVDSSDREVNIKILLNLAAEQGNLSLKQRDQLLARMTDEVARLVLRNNYLQTQAISMMESQAKQRINEHARLIRSLERAVGLDRVLEYLPGDDEILERKKSGSGLVRPELAVIVSYSKISLYNRLLRSDVPEDSYLGTELQQYFPKPLQRRYGELSSTHPLRREIIAMLIANSMINRMGPVFALRTQEETGHEAATVARAYAMAREVFNVRDLWQAIEALDNQVHSNVQYSMMFQTARLLRHATLWFLQYHPRALDVDALVSALRPGVSMLLKNLAGLLSGKEKKRFDEITQQHSMLGVPNRVARRLATLEAMTSALDIVEVAGDAGADVKHTAQLYFELGRGLKLDWLREEIERLKVEGRWQAAARGTLRESLYALQRSLTSQLLNEHPEGAPNEAVVAWLGRAGGQVTHVKQTLREMQATGELDFATLSVALQETRKLLAAA